MGAGEYLKVTSREVLGLIFAALESDDMMDWVSDCSLESPSNQASEEYGWLGQVPQMREWKGPRVIKKLSESSYTLRNKKYEATLGFKKDDMVREKLGQINARIAEFASRGNSHWAKLMSDLIIANGNGYDGNAFFYASHSEGDSGTLSNELTKTDYTALDFTTTGKPTAIEMSAAILAVIGHFYTYKDDQGEPINEFAKRFRVVCPTVDYWTAARAAVSKELLATSAGGAVSNTLLGKDLQIDVSLNNRLNQTSYTQYFYVFRTDAPIKPFIRQQEGGVDQQSLDENSDHYFKNDELLFGLKTNRAAGYGLWQYAIRADGTT